MLKSFPYMIAAAAAVFGASAQAGAPTTGGDAFPGILAGMVNQNGARFAPASVRGKLVLVNFIFTGCGTTCPTQTAALAKFDRSLPAMLRDKVAILSISVDPKNDHPAALRNYGAAFGIDGKHWRLLTGSPPEVMKVTRSFSAMKPGQANAAFHTSELRLFDDQGRMIQRYSGAPLATEQLRADLFSVARIG